jgi:hypothetical protein
MLYVLRRRVWGLFDREDQVRFCHQKYEIYSLAAVICYPPKSAVTPPCARTHPTGKSPLSRSLLLSLSLSTSTHPSPLSPLTTTTTYNPPPTASLSQPSPSFTLSFNSRLDFVSPSSISCFDRRISTRAEQSQMNLSKPSPYSASDAPGLLYASFNQG